MDMFVRALKNRYRFKFHGLISTEDLFQVNMDGLNDIYVELSKEKKDSNCDSLLDNTYESQELDDKIAIVKYIFDLQKKEKEERQAAIEKFANNQKILEIIADKENENLKTKSIEELKQLLV